MDALLLWLPGSDGRRSLEQTPSDETWTVEPGPSSSFCLWTASKGLLPKCAHLDGSQLLGHGLSFSRHIQTTDGKSRGRASYFSCRSEEAGARDEQAHRGDGHRRESASKGNTIRVQGTSSETQGLIPRRLCCLPLLCRRRVGDFVEWMQWWAEQCGIMVIAQSVDFAFSEAWDLSCPVAIALLCEMLMEGFIDLLLGGRPCGTFSRLRFRPGGPRPLRFRGSHKEWGRQDLFEWESILLD